MVDAVAPARDVFHADDAGPGVAALGVVADGALLAGAGHADAADAAGEEVAVALMVPEPVFHKLAPLLRVDAVGRKGVMGDAVEHGRVPLVVALHPAEVGRGAVLVAEEFRVSAPAVHDGVGHAVGAGHALLAGVAVGQKPGEVGRVDVFGARGVVAAEGVELVGEHVTDARGRAARSAVLIEDRREKGSERVVHMVGAAGRRVARAYGQAAPRGDKRRRTGSERQAATDYEQPKDS